jgi:hypothetical protein
MVAAAWVSVLLSEEAAGSMPEPASEAVREVALVQMSTLRWAEAEA